jgi:hypothetical protein
VLAAFPGAIYLRTTAPGDQVLAVVTADSLRLPCSVVLARSPELDFGSMSRSASTGSVTVGAGLIELPGGTIRVSRWWEPARPRRVHVASFDRRRLDALERLTPPLPADVAEAAATSAATPTRLAHQARRLVGLGPGLTPAGDDVLAAMILTLTAGPAAAREVAADLAAAVLPDAPSRTTALSAALLRHAARGCGLAQVVDLIDAVSSTGPIRLEGPLARLLAVGSSSGCGLAHGVLIGMRAMLVVSGAASTGLEVA